MVLVLSALWPLSTFTFLPKWDNIDCYLPYRNFVGYAVHQGEWPFWNPFQHMGYPAYSDMQNGMYNPIVWFLLLFGEYTTNSLIVELLIYYLIAIWGAYKFAGLFVQTKVAKTFIAVAFGLSGFMLGTSQIMIFIAGAAFLPHILFHFIRLLKHKQLIDVFYSVLFLALCITSASPAYTIVLIYILVAIFIHHLLQNIRSLKENITHTNWIQLTLLAVLLVCVLLPYINSVYEFLPYFNRANKLNYSSFLLENPFDFHEYISFLFPYTTLADSTWFANTDLTMRSGYIGILPLIFLGYSLKFRKEKQVKWLWIGMLIFLILCAGGTTPLYRFFYELPGFGLFRHPSLFRAHALLFAVVLSGIAFERWDQASNKKEIQWILLSILGVFTLIFIYTLLKPHTDDLKAFFANLSPSSPLIRHYIKTYLFINVALMIPLLFLSLRQLMKNANVKRFFVFILIADLVLYTQVTARYTIHYPMKNSDYVAYFKNLPSEIDQSRASLPYKQLSENFEPIIEGLWRNTATYHRALSYDGHNQTQFIHFNEVEQNGGLEMTKENPLFYDVNKRSVLAKESPLEPNVLWQREEKTQTIVNPESLQISNPHVEINSFSAKVLNQSDKPDLLVLNQNFHHLWKATINGKSTPIVRANDAFMSIEIPPKSTNDVVFTFSSPTTKWTFYFSLFSYLILFSGILILSAKNRNQVTD